MGKPCECLSRKLALFKAQPYGFEGGGTATFFLVLIVCFFQDAAKLMRKTVFEKSSNGRSYDAKCPNGAYTMGRPCEWLSRKLALFKV